MNSTIIAEFTQLIKQIKYDIDHGKKANAMVDMYRLKQISAALSIIKAYPKEITSGAQLADIKGIGKGTVKRIDEIIKTGHLSEIKIREPDEKYLAQIDELTQIFGIGRRVAYDMIVNNNIRSIDELDKAFKTGKIELPYHITLGLKYHKIYKESIPRTEVTEIDGFIQKAIRSVDPTLFGVICGSYRRGRDTSNDIDILLSNKGPNNEKLLKQLVTKLRESHFILDDIDPNYKVKYMGFCKFGSNPVRRLDIMYVPYKSYYTALVHFTGSGEFNRKIRELALELGYTLSQHGLYVVKNGKKDKMIPITSEKDLFDKLGLEYVPPEKRSL
jgi:DNA polymerase/3'-5' exonuclease PolX